MKVFTKIFDIVAPFGSEKRKIVKKAIASIGRYNAVIDKLESSKADIEKALADLEVLRDMSHGQEKIDSLKQDYENELRNLNITVADAECGRKQAIAELKNLIN